MRQFSTRRTFVMGAIAGVIPTAAVALPPFCRALRLANYGGPAMNVWAEALLSEVRRRIKWDDGLQIFDGLQLSPPQQAAQATAAGVIDLTTMRGAAAASLAPDLAVLDDPRVGRAIVTSDPRLGTLLARLSRVAADANLVLLGVAWNTDLLVLRSGTNFGSISDLKGKSIRPSSAQNEALVAELDAAPKPQPVLTSLQALQSGAIDGAIVSPAALAASKVTAGLVVNFEGRMVLGQGFAMLINRDTLSKAGNQAQQAFQQAGPISAEIYKKAEQAARAKVIAAQEAAGAKVLTFSADQVGGLADRIARRVDGQYNKVSEETRKIVQIFSAGGL